MEYIITKAQLYRVMTKFLNNFKNTHEETFFEDFIWLSKPSTEDFILDMQYEYNNGNLTIDIDWLENLMSWFPINKEDAEDFIKDWFEQSYDVTVQSVESYNLI